MAAGADAGLIRDLLTRARVIAMVGASPDAFRPSFGIMRYLQRQGYRVIPVNPTALGAPLHGEAVFPSVQAIGTAVDIVNVFRRSAAIGEVVEDAIAAGAPAIWLQLGIRNDGACARAAAAGLQVVTDRCISVEHSRLGRRA